MKQVSHPYPVVKENMCLATKENEHYRGRRDGGVLPWWRVGFRGSWLGVGREGLVFGWEGGRAHLAGDGEAWTVGER